MAVCFIFDTPGATRAHYGRVFNTEEGSTAPAGMLFHAAGPTEGGWVVVEMWESESVARAFYERLFPALKAAGFPPVEPKVFTVDNFYRAPAPSAGSG